MARTLDRVRRQRFRYEIVDERGSDYIRDKILKTILRREQEIVAEGPARAELTEENYEFAETGAEATASATS